MLREMIRRLAETADGEATADHLDRLARVLFDELALMPRDGRKLRTSDHPKVAVLTAALTADPADRRIVGEGLRTLRCVSAPLSGC